MSNPLLKQAEIREQPFESRLPLVGPLIAAVRTLWNNVAARWYVQALFRQQNAYNRLLAQQLMAQEERIVAQDRDLVQLTRQVAELELQVKQLSRRLAAGDDG